MSRRIGAKNRALADQVVAVLRGADGFPMSTGEIASHLGGRLYTYGSRRPVPQPRPVCWTEDTVDDPSLSNRSRCEKCNGFHREPVWRRYDGQDIRGVLNGLAKRGEIEKVVLEDTRNHYWRRDDSDCEVVLDG